MKRLLPVLLCLPILGCTYNLAKVWDPKSGNLVGKSRTLTFADSKSVLKGLHINTETVTNKHGVFSAGISIGDLSQDSSTTNLNAILQSVMQGAMEGLIKGMGKP